MPTLKPACLITSGPTLPMQEYLLGTPSTQGLNALYTLVDECCPYTLHELDKLLPKEQAAETLSYRRWAEC